MTSDSTPAASVDEPVSPRSLAELARSGFSILRQPAMQVEYEVHHVHDRSGYLQDVLRGRYSRLFDQSEHKPPFIETLTTAAHGVGLVVGVRLVGGGPDMHDQLIERRRLTVLRADDPAGESRAFRGVAQPNVSFVYDTARMFEGLISVEVDSVPLQLAHHRAIRAVMSEIARVAVGVAKAPVLSLQSPVQLPPYEPNKPETESRARTRTWPRSSALAVRFAIALLRPTAELRLQIADALTAFCKESGFGLRLADSRSGYRAGNWFTILDHNTEQVHQAFDHTLDPNGASQAQACLPITFVGPARTDSIQAILDYLAYYPELGILACSMATIDDIAFIHLQLAVSAATKSGLETLNVSLDVPTVQANHPPSLLPIVVSHLVATDREVDQEVELRFAHRVGDYQLLVGPALPVRPEVARGALWVSWEVEGRNAELRVPFLALHDALADLFAGVGIMGAKPPVMPNVEYLICRKVRNSVLRGKGKLSFPAEIARDNFGYTDLPTALSALSVRIENAWRAKLDEKHRMRELTVSWREYWLGHWTSPLD